MTVDTFWFDLIVFLLRRLALRIKQMAMMIMASMTGIAKTFIANEATPIVAKGMK